MKDETSAHLSFVNLSLFMHTSAPRRPENNESVFFLTAVDHLNEHAAPVEYSTFRVIIPGFRATLVSASVSRAIHHFCLPPHFFLTLLHLALT